MTVNFYIQSKKNPASIYVRVREGKEIDAKANTKLLVNPEEFHKGEVKFYKIPPKADAKRKQSLAQKNDYLNNLQSELNELKTSLIEILNKREEYEVIDTVWLKNFINPDKEYKSLPNNLTEYFEYYIESKKSSLAFSTIKKMKSTKNRVARFENEDGRVYIQDVNKRFSKKFQLWCDEEGYHHNTKVKTLKDIKTVCVHASENGIPTHPELLYIVKDLRYKKAEHIFLNFDEIRNVIESDIKDERLDAARDWLVISCYTAQRVSDFLKFNKEKVIKIKGVEMLDISQEKTEMPVYIPLTKEVKEILKKREGDFPPLFSQNVDSNKAIYNKLIKEVCRIANIKELVETKQKNKKTNRYETKIVPKYKAVSTHIGRRSFATNYYGKINTALLISATGHSSEEQFLRYVGKTGTQNALALAEAMSKLTE